MRSSTLEGGSRHETTGAGGDARGTGAGEEAWRELIEEVSSIEERPARRSGGESARPSVVPRVRYNMD